MAGCHSPFPLVGLPGRDFSFPLAQEVTFKARRSRSSDCEGSICFEGSSKQEVIAGVGACVYIPTWFGVGGHLIADEREKAAVGR